MDIIGCARRRGRSNSTGEPVNDFDVLHHETEADFESVKRGYGLPDVFEAGFTRKPHLYRLLFAFPTLVDLYR